MIRQVGRAVCSVGHCLLRREIGIPTTLSDVLPNQITLPTVPLLSLSPFLYLSASLPLYLATPLLLPTSIPLLPLSTIRAHCFLSIDYLLEKVCYTGQG